MPSFIEKKEDQMHFFFGTKKGAVSPLIIDSFEQSLLGL